MVEKVESLWHTFYRAYSLSDRKDVMLRTETKEDTKMIVCVAVDDKNGMMFNKRRQSQDRILREHMLKECEGSVLWMNEYTAKQFDDCMTPNIVIDNDLLKKAGEGDYCFVENLSLEEIESQIQKIILFKWNRVYPADWYFDTLLRDWVLTETEEFAGSSHKLITKEVWVHE